MKTQYAGLQKQRMHRCKQGFVPTQARGHGVGVGMSQAQGHEVGVGIMITKGEGLLVGAHSSHQKHNDWA